MPITAPPAETAWLLHHVLGFDAIGGGRHRRDPGGGGAPRRGRAGAARPQRRRDRRASGGRRRCIVPPGFARGVSRLRRGRLDRHRRRPQPWRPGSAAALGLAAHRDVHQRQLRLRPLPDADAGRDPCCWRRTARADQQARFLPRLMCGDWTGTMCLTEPQSGSDLSGVRTRAVPDGRGGFRISGAEDLHHLRRARDDREHPAHGARPPARRAGRQRRHLAVRGAEAARRRRSPTACAAWRSSRSSASTRARPARWNSRTRRARWSGRRTRGWPACSR